MISMAAAVAGAVFVAVVCVVIGRISVARSLPEPATASGSAPTRLPNTEFVVDTPSKAGEVGSAPARMFNKRTGSTSFFEPDENLELMKETNRKLQERLVEVEEVLKKKVQSTTTGESEGKTDPLTNLFDRRAFDEKLAECCSARETGADDGSVILMEIDRLLEISERHGRPAGDFVMSRLAGIVRDTIGSEGFAARYGEDEFGVILPRASVYRSKIIAERIRKNCDVAHDYVGTAIKTSMSLGLTDCAASIDLTLAGLERALHAAKEAGCNRTFACEGIEITPVEIAALTHSDANAGAPGEEEPKKDAWFDRRGGSRRGFETMQWLAPCVPGKPIRRESFREVRCRDISLGGFSFVLDESPDFDEVIVGLGAFPNMTYVRAKVVHIEKCNPTPKSFLIGCRFAERITKGPEPMPLG